MKVSSSEGYTGVRFIDASTERDEQVKLKQSITTLTTPEEPYESRGSRTVLRGAGGESPLAYSTIRVLYSLYEAGQVKSTYTLSEANYISMEIETLSKIKLWLAPEPCQNV